MKPGTALLQDMLVLVVNTAADEAGIRVGDELCASAEGANVTALLAPPMPEVFYAADATAGMSVWGPIVAQLREDALKETDTLKARLAKATSRFEFRTTPLEFVLSRETALINARHSDMTIVTLPAERVDRVYAREMMEAVLFQSGRPVLLVPHNWKKPAAFKKIVVAWKPTREAARALGDAADFLAAASNVTVVTVDAKPSFAGPGEAPGADIATHLARRNVKVDLRNVDSMGRSEADAILDAAHEVGADLIVLGAFGHSRLRQMVFGGVTKHLLEATDTPLFVSH
jgi:nucleotide-binding universal stress UspA family protein